MLPNFLVIGGMKCGTTSLDYYLKAHPEIAMPSKEVDFFSRNYHLGLGWYESLFKEKNEETKTYGETSVSYAKYPYHEGVPKRIYSVLPDVKLIYVVRDPIDRIISHYMHLVYADAEDRPFDKVFEEEGVESLYVYYSLYYLQIEKYLEYFHKDQILIIYLDNLREMSKRLITLRQVFKFLNIATDIESPKFYEAKQQRTKKGVKNILAKFISTLPFYRRIVDISPGFIRDFYIKIFTRKLDFPVIPDKLKNQLINVLKPDTEKLREFSGYRFESWCL